MITLTVFLPAIAALIVLLIPRENTRAVRYTALFGSLAALGFAVAILLEYVPGAEGQFQFTETYRWIPSLGIFYRVGIDGISLFMVVLTALLTPICVLCSWRQIDRRVHEFHIALLLLEVGILGVFVALDLMLFYVFWEVMLIPMYLLIGMWGSGNRIYAAVKFFIYTMAGSLLMFLAILYLYFHVAAHLPTGGEASAFDIATIYDVLKSHPLEGSPGMLCFLAFALSFAIKVPLFPFHTWLPDAHTEAPTAGSVILAGVLLKLGTYGFIRFAIPFFPQAAIEATPWITTLSVVGIIFGACMCLVQDDMKRLIAYSSVSHLGFVMLGIFALTARGVVGGLYQMVNHGISTGALFLLVGVIYERRHTRQIADYGGIGAVTPRLATVFFVTTLSSIGLPFLNGFVGEFLILQGTFERITGPGSLFEHLDWAVCTALAGTGIILGAVYMLTLYRRLFLGEIKQQANRTLPDLDSREMGFLVPLVVLMVVLGLFSPLLTERMLPSVEIWLEYVGK
jgi:NADH-quinone oxidoreductase subunit M